MELHLNNITKYLMSKEVSVKYAGMKYLVEDAILTIAILPEKYEDYCAFIVIMD